MNIALTRVNFSGSFSIVEESVVGILGNAGFLCLIGSRMFLNLKKAGDSEVDEGSNIPKNNEGPVSTISDPQFAGPAIISSALGKLRFDFRTTH